MPPQQLRQFSAEVQTQACALLPRATVRELAESSKEPFFILWANTHPCINHLEFDGLTDVPCALVKNQAHASFLRELDGVVRKIQQNLLQGPPVTLKNHVLLRHAGGKEQPFLLSEGPQGCHYFIDDI